LALADVWREVYRIAKLQIAKTQFFFAWLITKCDSPQKTNQELQRKGGRRARGWPHVSFL